MIWSQPPLEWDPGLGTPVYCGWNEPAYATRPYASGSIAWKVAADDFRSLPNTPVTAVNWWGAYTAWEGIAPPRVTPASWRIGFWSNVPADSRHAFARPGKLLWLVSAEAERVEEAFVGLDEFPDEPSDTCFRYALTLEPYEYFWHDDLADSDDPVVWISITALYSGSTGPDYAWGWKTRPQPWNNGSVTFSARRDDLRAGMEIDSEVVEPITNSLLCERLDKYDMAFELDTNPTFVKWEQAFTGMRHWEYYENEESLATIETASTVKWDQDPDVTALGMAVDITDDIPTTWPAQIAADDFQCTTPGPITGITLWGSWYHGVLPGGDATDVTFTLSIRANVPASQSGVGHSVPGTVLWRKEFKPGAFTVQRQETRSQSYYSPANAAFEADNHNRIFKYGFEIDVKEAFQQQGTTGTPVVYWLTVQADLIHAPGSVATRFGWNASDSHWNGAAVWAQGQEPYTGPWDDLVYPKGHSASGSRTDLAFEIETQQTGTGLTYRRLVADDWQCNDDGAVTGLVWWGSYIGYGYEACACEQMALPQQPDYFLLSIWTDGSTEGVQAYGRPGRKVWQYRAEDFDEVLVGFDRYAGTIDGDKVGLEPVYRYTVTLPKEDWFCQEDDQDIYWLSIAAVYEDPGTMTYPWGWTNNPSEPWDLPETDALAYWKLDETTGSVAADSSGNGNTGRLAGDPVWRPEAGWLGGAIDLDGRSDYIKVDNPIGFDFAPGSFSASVWVNPRQTRGRWQAIMEYDRDSTNGNRFGLWIDTEGRFHFRVGLNTWHSSQGLEAGQWHLLTATYNGDTHEMMIYVNGLLDAVAVNSKGFVEPTKSTLTLGAAGDESDEFFEGYLDEIRVFGTALSDQDVLTLLGVSRNDAAVAGQFDEGSDSWQWTQLYDRTGTREDVSFMLITNAEPCSDADQGGQDKADDKTDTKDDNVDVDDKDSSSKDLKDSSSKDSTSEKSSSKDSASTESSSKEDATKTEKR